MLLYAEYYPLIPQSRIESVYCRYKVLTESIDVVDVRSRAEYKSRVLGRFVFRSSVFHPYRRC